MISFDLLCQPVPWLSAVPEDKDMRMGTCSGNAKSGFCSDIAYLLQRDRGRERELREAKEIIKMKSLIFTHCLYKTDQEHKICNNLCPRKHVVLSGNGTIH